MKVIEWHSEKNGMIEMGGFFENGMRWSDYIDRYTEAGAKYFNAIRDGVLENHIKITGEQMQNEDYNIGFDNGESISFSWRAWGDLMAAIWSEKENKDYSYMDFYM